ncbi:iron ABC transporter permease [Kineosporia rhizophila]|uniref:FecCD family ABC transporter permease n=1 Tax=Kineosporia rhizophila TaxID=84633 RepID=UPI000B300A76|nr:iron ABC transporter permease [Kineosporia rhizophila]
MSTTEQVTTSGAAIVRRPRRVRLAWFLIGLAVLALLVVASIVVGTRFVPVPTILDALRGSNTTLEEAVIRVRIPRTALAIVAGAALAVSGAVFQGVTRNPLADPGILGINMGASLAVITGLAYFGLSQSTTYIWVAIAGAALAAIFVYAVGSLGRGGPTPLKLALAGAATSAALISFTTAIILPRGDISENVQSWQIGGVGGATFPRIWQVMPFLVVGLAICFLSAKSLNSLALGDDVAAGLGERVAVARGLASLGAVMLCGAATAICGPISFVGLVVPHLCRLLVGPDHRWLLPFTALTGSCLLVAADVLGRIVARPSEIDVGIITAFVGAPFFIYIVRRQKVRAL